MVKKTKTQNQEKFVMKNVKKPGQIKRKEQKKLINPEDEEIKK